MANLVLQDVCSGYGGTPVLRDVSLTVGVGEIVAVVGANGAGKSTLLRTIAGLLAPTRGSIVYGGKTINRASTGAIRKAGIGHAPEGRHIFLSMTVYENLLLGTYAVQRAHRSATLAEQLKLVYSLFPILQDMRHRDAGVLSGGQQQMLCLGRTIMSKPTLLLLDEPSMGLAPNLVRTILDAVALLARQGVSVLLVEQVVGLALSASTRTYVLRGGGVVLEGESRSLAADEAAMHLAYFGAQGRPPAPAPVALQPVQANQLSSHVAHGLEVETDDH